MTILDFNNKVNLPRFCSKQDDLKNLTFKKIPVVGWLAYQEGELIGTIFDLVSHDKALELFKFITTKRPEYLESGIKLEYNERTEKLVNKSYQTALLWESIVKEAQQEMRVHKIKQNYETISCIEFYNQQGKPGVGLNNMGLLTNEIRKKYHMVPWPESLKYGKILILPSYITPKHIFSVEYTKTSSLEDLHSFYRLHPNRELGWYGSINTKLVGDIRNLETDKGFTYSSYIKPFIKDDLDVDDNVPLSNLFDINCSTEAVVGFAQMKSKLEDQSFDELKQDLSNLNKREVIKLESKLNVELSDAWVESRRSIREVNQKLYEKRPNGYYEISKNSEVQITDFIFDDVKLVDSNGELIVKAEFVNCDTVQSIEFNYKIFGYNFFLNLNKILVGYGLGIPFVDPSYESLLPRLILLFSR